MWPFTTQQERQTEAMSQILAENAYERKMERAAGWVRTFIALIGGVALTFMILIGLESLEINPSDVWSWIKSLFS
tara:strand:- start:3361 stop:3585 length:225 start_codon:yes stop_codon:yes gene_type:complete